MRKLKVLHVITHLGVGGALDNTLLTIEGLPRDRYEVDLAAGPLEANYSSWEDRSRRAADQLIAISHLQREVRPDRDLRAFTQLLSCIRQGGYDVVHTHCAKAGVLGRMAAFRAKTPVVVHTCHAFGMQVARVAPARRWLKAVGRLKEWTFSAAERQASRLSDRVITVCEQNRRQALEQRLAPAEKLQTIYSGIDRSKFQTAFDRSEVCEEFKVDASRPIVGFIGRLAPQKAPLDFVAAAKLVLRRRPDVQFVLAGDGPLAEEVKIAIGGDPRFHRIGFYRDVPRLFAGLDVLAVSSLWEGLGRSVTEAVLAKTPVAATAVDGIPELIEHEATGLLSPPADPAALAGNILRLLDSPRMATKLADEASRRVGTKFDADRMVQRIDALYQEVAREKGEAPFSARVGAPQEQLHRLTT